MSEIALTRCVVNPYFGGDLCAPDSTIEQDAIKGKWVRVPRNLNWEGNYGSGWLVSIRSIRIPMLNAPHNSRRRYIIEEQGDKISILS